MTASQLLEHWRAEYERAFGVPYGAGTEPYNLELCSALLAACSMRVATAKGAITALLTSPELDWVNSKNLEWLSKAKNLTYVLPTIRRAAATTATEWSGERASTPTTKVRRRP